MARLFVLSLHSTPTGYRLFSELLDTAVVFASKQNINIGFSPVDNIEKLTDILAIG